MADLYANANDGQIWKVVTNSSWSDARDATAGTSGLDNSHFSNTAWLAYNVSVVRYVMRSFFKFDFSSVSGTLDSATFRIYGKQAALGNGILVKTNAFTSGGDLAAGDFDAIVGFSSGDTMHGNVTVYAGNGTSASIDKSSYSTSAYNDVTLNDTAINDINTNSEIQFAIVEYDYDYKNVEPGSGTTHYCGAWMTDEEGTSKDPMIRYTVASGYGHEVNSVASANISTVKGVATASISKVIGV